MRKLNKTRTQPWPGRRVSSSGSGNRHVEEVCSPSPSNGTSWRDRNGPCQPRRGATCCCSTPHLRARPRAFRWLPRTTRQASLDRTPDSCSDSPHCAFGLRHSADAGPRLRARISGGEEHRPAAGGRRRARESSSCRLRRAQGTLDRRPAKAFSSTTRICWSASAPATTRPRARPIGKHTGPPSTPSFSCSTIWERIASPSGWRTPSPRSLPTGATAGNTDYRRRPTSADLTSDTEQPLPDFTTPGGTPVQQANAGGGACWALVRARGCLRCAGSVRMPPTVDCLANPAAAGMRTT